MSPCECDGCKQPMLEGLKRCSQCHWPRPLGWYVSNGGSRLRAACRQCMRPKRNNDTARRRERIKSTGGKLTRVTTEVIRRLMQNQNYICACGCGQSVRWEYHLDHKIPLARGGKHEMSNWQLLTPKCNLRKGSKYA